MSSVLKPVILCVDDEKIVLDSLVNQLRNYFGNDYLYETAENVDEAWEVVNEMREAGHLLAVVISDWLMPVERGDQFLIELAGQLPKTSLIMLSGHADDESVEKARKYANLHCFIRKPWDKEHLLSEVETAIEKSNKAYGLS